MKNSNTSKAASADGRFFNSLGRYQTLMMDFTVLRQFQSLLSKERDFSTSAEMISPIQNMRSQERDPIFGIGEYF